MLYTSLEELDADELFFCFHPLDAMLQTYPLLPCLHSMSTCLVHIPSLPVPTSQSQVSFPFPTASISC